MPRFKDRDWNLPANATGGIHSWEHVQIAVLLDIRDELQRIRDVQNALAMRMNCREALAIPSLLRSIKANTTKKRRKKSLESK